MYFSRAVFKSSYWALDYRVYIEDIVFIYLRFCTEKKQILNIKQNKVQKKKQLNNTNVGLFLLWKETA